MNTFHFLGISKAPPELQVLAHSGTLLQGVLSPRPPPHLPTRVPLFLSQEDSGSLQPSAD